MRLMRVRAWCAMVIFLLNIGLVYGQPVPRTNPNEDKKEEKQELGPATSKTKEEVENSVKAPVAIPALPTAAPVDPKTYVIGPEDILSVRVWREPELSSAVQVRPDGKITLPLIGEMEAAGQTPEGLKAKVVEALQEYIIKPDVIVSLQSVQSRKYYITGEVTRPGTFPLVVPVTILEALTNAGGFKEFANTKKITDSPKRQDFEIQLQRCRQGEEQQQNIQIENGDYIVVP